MSIFNQFLFDPLFNFLVFLYNTIAFQDFGVAIILLTIAIRLILSPLSIKSIKSQRAIQELQPKLKEIQDKYKGDKQKQTEETMKIYKDQKVNPFSGCLPLIIQLPILIALYKVSLSGLNSATLNSLYGFIARPEHINSTSLGFLDLTAKNWFLAVFAGLAQFIQSKLSLRKKVTQEKSSKPMAAEALNKQMLYFFPVITIMIAGSFPASLSLYWVTTTLFSVGEQLVVNKLLKNGAGNK